MTTELQPVNDASQVRNQVVDAGGVIELPTDFDLPGAGRSHVVRNCTVLSTERSRVD